MQLQIASAKEICASWSSGLLSNNLTTRPFLLLGVVEARPLTTLSPASTAVQLASNSGRTWFEPSSRMSSSFLVAFCVWKRSWADVDLWYVVLPSAGNGKHETASPGQVIHGSAAGYLYSLVMKYFDCRVFLVHLH